MFVFCITNKGKTTQIIFLHTQTINAIEPNNNYYTKTCIYLTHLLLEVYITSYMIYQGLLTTLIYSRVYFIVVTFSTTTKK